jgi:hypothetical protein
VGKLIPPFPSGTLDGRGACVGDMPNMCSRGIGVLKTSNGRGFLIFTGLGEKENGTGHWRVSDVIPYPNVPRDSEFVKSDCRKFGISDQSIIAIVRGDPRQRWLRASHWAYRVEAATGKFAKLDPTGVDCENPLLDKG